MKLPRLLRSALLRYRYEELSLSGQSVKVVRNDNARIERRLPRRYAPRNDNINRPSRAVIPRKGAQRLFVGISPLITQSGLIIFCSFGYFNIIKIIVS